MGASGGDASGSGRGVDLFEVVRRTAGQCEAEVRITMWLVDRGVMSRRQWRSPNLPRTGRGLLEAMS